VVALEVDMDASSLAFGTWPLLQFASVVPAAPPKLWLPDPPIQLFVVMTLSCRAILPV
jgi:hypothetical protein